MEEIYYAHSQNGVGDRHALAEHLRCVSRLAGEFAGDSSLRSEAELAGLLHDLGKYGERFQARLRGEDQGLDHWSAGAWMALSEYGSMAAALAIQGHHIGLQELCQSKDAWLSALQPERLLAKHPLQLALSHASLPELKSRLSADGLNLAKPDRTLCGMELCSDLPRMLDIRMLFSALVDADFLDTEAHFNGNREGKAYRTAGPALHAEQALNILLEHIEKLAKQSESDEKVALTRAALRTACLDAAEQDPGLFTLTAPTGSGKTLAMLAFALAHARRHGLRRVVMVIPYLSIIEQTARIYREIFAPHFGPDYVLEHHSLAGRGSEGHKSDNEDDSTERRRRLLSENWDAPLIITTSVQALESLFSNRPSACRKLHRLRQSVILFDEVQTLPPSLAVPSLAALSHLAHDHDSSVVFSTATQPAFEHLHEAVRMHSSQGWKPRPIVSNPSTLFAPMRRVEVYWPEAGEMLSWNELAERLLEQPQALCVVNLKRHAQALWEAMADEGTFQLSTNLCAAHRQAVLTEVRKRLKARLPVRMIATQCIEAGVDVDFPVVWRAHGPLDAIIQAAGRCNREGRLDMGQVHVFMPEDAAYPPGAYAQAAQVTAMWLERHRKVGLDLDNPDFITAYYRELYDIGRPEHSKKTRQIEEYIKAGAFPETAHEYRLIDQDTINVVVPYQDDMEIFRQLSDMADEEGLTACWIKQARPLVVSLFRPKQDDVVWDGLIPVVSKRQRGRSRNEDWFIATVSEHYHPVLGYRPPKSLNLWIG
ncbi:CRISPR-associated helicase Cas3' [Methylococcus sp. EFPC2]|uniref:CRISPR-associated helicase Cas3' n=1 Tax=Methylococcus sp. EFPC2 TaxID=2812648 RepID=UPI0019682CC0|nr:CRISPR-associated helicase Cas3' [Methylococcus sp. EFPC2]QSA96043.1 CRISPR-associated helicase Cas3' [Methylococcus sp. EFPC2]